MTATDDQSPVVIPERIAALGPISGNLWWSWKPEVEALYRDLDPALYAETADNPALFMQRVAPERLARAAADPAYLARYDEARVAFERLLPVNPANTWVGQHRPELAGPTVAYFSAEFALHQSLPIYAGGLGVLAGDHCKEASDLGVPLIGVGFMYPQGYFHQNVSAEGWQQELYERLSWDDAPTGIGVTLLCAVLIAVVVAALSNAIALLVRQQEALIGISQFVVLPLQFLSSAVMDTRLSPGWVRHVARYNPVDWAVTASREALSADTHWDAVLPRVGWLALLALVMGWLATRAFGAYQRSA